MQDSKYLVANDRDAQWGLVVNTVGYDEVGPDEDYPTKGHGDGYFFLMLSAAACLMNIRCSIL